MFKNFGGPGSGRYPAGSGERTTAAGVKVLQTKDNKGNVIKEERAPIDKAFPGHKFTVKIDGKDEDVRNVFKMNSKPDGTGIEGYGVETQAKYNKWFPTDKIRDIRKVKI